jgi:hypothetical protein
VLKKLKSLKILNLEHQRDPLESLSGVALLIYIKKNNLAGFKSMQSALEEIEANLPSSIV